MVYRAGRQGLPPVILKALSKERPPIEEIAARKREYEILKKLNSEGIIKALGLHESGHGPVLVLEDFGGQSLDRFIRRESLNLLEAVRLAVRVIDIIGEIHTANIIHKDINPANIVFNRAGGKLKLIDFDLAGIFSREHATLQGTRFQGTLQYTSPEQTGRTNRWVDYRTDYYSLGATLYELICGRPPFNSSDSLELVHSHIARVPASPSELKPSIPQMLSDMVMKLLSKNPDSRYQSAWGLKSDLEECLRQLETKGRIAAFHLAKKDKPERFQVSEKLFCREQEIADLGLALERASNGTKEIVLISGSPGVGKTALANEVCRPAPDKLLRLISGKFEQFHHDVPYAAVAMAFSGMVRQILTESEEQLSQWRKELLEALGAGGRIVMDVVPELELIIGPQPTPTEVDPKEYRNRFHRLFQKFVQVFCTPQHPLAIFLDDLQWADSASLNLLESIIVDEEIKYLLLIGAFRDKEVDSSHPLTRSIERLLGQGHSINRIQLDSLDRECVAKLCAGTLRVDEGSVTSLADLTFDKTGGNPFHVNEFLKSLYLEKLLRYIPHEEFWEWDLDQIRGRGITDNVVELMAGKIQRLGDDVQDALTLAACMGNRFELDALAIVQQKPRIDTLRSLMPAVAEGLVLPMSDAWKYVAPESQDAEGPIVEFKFCHDRVQQAAYSAIPESQEAAVHLEVGRSLLNKTPYDKLETKIFDIVNQLNFGIDLLDRQGERAELARLNMRAGRKAMSSAAYEAAFNHFEAGIRALGQSSWTTWYDLTLQLHVHATETAYLTADFQSMERFSSRVLEKAKDILDKARVYEIKIQAAIAQYNMLEAMKIALGVLRMLGVRIPKNPSKLHIALALVKTRLLFLGKNIESLLELPEMTNRKSLAAIRIMSSVGKAAYASQPMIFPILATHSVNLSLKYGNAPESAMAYACYGMLLASVVGNIDDAYRFGDLALNMLEKFSSGGLRVNTIEVVHFFIKPWKEHYAKQFDSLLGAYKSGLECGSFEEAAHCAYMYCSGLFRVGRELAEVAEEMAYYCDSIRKIRHESALRLLAIFRQAVLNLMGQSSDPCRLVGEAFDEDKTLPLHRAANDRSAICVTYLNKLALCYLFENYSAAQENAVITAEYLNGVIGTPAVPVFYFYDSLVRLALHVADEDGRKDTALRKVRQNQRRLKKWSDHGPMNHLHKFMLVEAERFRLLGKYDKAEKCYEEAIRLAKENEYLNEQALARELAARFYLSRGASDKGLSCMLDARYCYEKWGAQAKVKFMDEKYRQLFRSNPYSGTSEHDAPRSSSVSTGFNENLDLASVTKAFQVISAEIVLERLVDKLMNIVLEAGGAQKGFLILQSKDGLSVRSEVRVDEDVTPVLKSIPVEDCSEISHAIVHYVGRTMESVVLNDAARQGVFVTDPYVLSKTPRSVVCTPLIHQGRLTGMLYLENNLATHTFTPERVEILRVLCSQAAISLENAQLYERMEQLVAERTAALQCSNEELSREIEVRQQAQQALYHAKMEAEAANRAKGEFLANVSHELRTPLNAIIGFSQLLKDQWGGKLSEKQLQYVSEIYGGGHHLLQLINDILDLAKVESGKMDLHFSRLNLGQLVKYATIMIKQRAMKHRLEISVDVRDDLEKMDIMADEVKLKQIVVNLLSNAAKFTEDGGKIGLTASREGNELVVTVSDTGIGIRIEDQERIFEPFEQVDSSLARRQRGTGLGLTLTRDLVRLHCGRIWVQSEGDGKGSTFGFTIPFVPAEKEAGQIKYTETDDVANHLLDDVRNSRIKILVVEDDAPNRELVARLLEKQSYGVLKACTAEEGICLAQAEVPDLILMDVSLPGIDGLTATRMLKQDSQTSDIPVVAVTAHALRGDEQKALEAGCNAYLSKPLNKSEFYRVIKSLVDR